MTPLVPIGLGLVLLATGFLILRTFGPRYRVGRLLASTPQVSIAEAVRSADAAPGYVAVAGRIDAEDVFEDDAHKPLVLRRARIQRRDGSRWTTLDEHVEAVPFVIREGLDEIAVDHAALDDGLVVVPRESVGTAGDIPERVPAGIAPETPIRLRVDLVSSVEHAIVLGVPGRPRPDGPVTMTAGHGRPLILSTLERGEAMRILAEGGERRPLMAAAAFVCGALALTVGIAWAVIGAATGTASAASPIASPPAGGDPRSSGSGPGLVGAPLQAIAIVIAIGLAAAVVTFIYVRFTSGRRA